MTKVDEGQIVLGSLEKIPRHRQPRTVCLSPDVGKAPGLQYIGVDTGIFIVGRGAMIPWSEP